MSKQAENNETKLPSGANLAEEFRAPVVFATVPMNDVLGHTQKLYDQKKDVFLASTIQDEDLPKKTKQWEKASRQLIEAAASLFLRSKASVDDRERALDIINTCKKDSSIRENNMMLHYESVLRDDPDNTKRQDFLFNAVLDSQHFYFRAVQTQQSYLNRFLNAADYLDPELRAEKEASARVATYRHRIPKGHHFLPARPFPPMRIPEGEQVPYPPEPFLEWKALPKSDFIYDEDHDEFVLPKGYVNKEKRIDDQSVVWDWENNTVTMKFIDGDAVTWPFWKPKDTADVLHEGDWCAEYLIRVYKRMLEDIQPPGMRPDDD